MNWNLARLITSGVFVGVALLAMLESSERQAWICVVVLGIHQTLDVIRDIRIEGRAASYRVMSDESAREFREHWKNTIVG